MGCYNPLCARYGCQRHPPCNQGFYAPIYPPVTVPQQGCICPPTSEQTCANPLCPRKAPVAP